MPNSRTPSLLDATALAFSPGQNAHPSPPYSERFSSPSTPRSAVDFQAQFPQQTQQYYGPQKPYGYQPYPLFNGFTQAYEYGFTPPPPPCPAQPYGAVPWYPQQNGYNGYVDYRADQYEPFADQFTELQGVRNGCIPGQNTWHHYGTDGYMNNNNNNYNNAAPKKIAKKNKRKKMNKLKRDYARAEEQQAEELSTQTQPKSKTDAKKQKAEQQNEHKHKTKVKTAAVEPVTKVCSVIGG